eukprot:c12862_g1_i1 orf=2-178(-)
MASIQNLAAKRTLHKPLGKAFQMQSRHFGRSRNSLIFVPLKAGKGARLSSPPVALDGEP